VKVEIWSDIACPWCFVGKRRFEEALGGFAHRDHVDVEWKSFELDPGAPSAADSPAAERTDEAGRLAAKYAMTRAQAEQSHRTMTETGAGLGIDFRFDRSVTANTFDAHQVVHLAADHGLQDAMKDRLFRAHFTDGHDVSDRDHLVRLAAEVGLPEAAVREALESQRLASDVRSDEAEAQALGISGVPFFVVDRAYGVSGAQPPEQLLAVLERAWAERVPLTVTGYDGPGAAAEACGPDGCAR
jgi:predicted DsbA family dithiol-disulfide isomerase